VPFRFEGLDIWHKARAYASLVYALTAKFPRHEDYGLKSQMNRAVNSISLNVAEGSGKSTKAFGYHLEISVGSICEVVGASFLALAGLYCR
jgi:four helix bundle protein